MKKLLLVLMVLVSAVVAKAVVPVVTIASSKGTTICSGDTVVYTATPVNGGTTPSYQWLVNNNPAGANNSTFTITSLSNGDVVSCIMMSNDPAANPTTDTSNLIAMTVNPRLTPIVAITLSPNDTICDGTTVTFTATIANGGSLPHFQWKLNGANVGGDSAKYIISTLADGDIVACELTSNETCVTKTKDTSNEITMKVNPNLTPIVDIAVVPNDTICAGTSVTFSATNANGGANPVYQWRRNGVVVGSNSSTYNQSGMVNGDAVLCIMTSSEACVTKQKDTSDVIAMTVFPNLTPEVTIVVTKDTICAGDAVTFTATPVNGGATPSYQWKVNGAIAGTNSPIFNIGGLVNGNVVTCEMTSSEMCVTKAKDTSNAITMIVYPIITPDVTITVAPNDTICAGTMTTFTAAPLNGGTMPSYQWKLNGFNTGNNSATYSSSTLNSGDVVSVIMTSNGFCTTKPADTSNAVTMHVIPNVTPVVVITHFPNDTICEGTNVTFTANSANGGIAPVYQWTRNGANVGTNSLTYNSTALNNGDVVSCIMTSSEMCVTKQKDTSNDITVGVNVKVEPMVTITAAPGDTACAGSPVTFTAVAVNTKNPSYQWQVNGSDVGGNSTTYISSSLMSGDMVRCIVMTPDTCVTKNSDTSNVITMFIKPILTPDVTITVAPNDTVCQNDVTTFTATPVNGGTTPVYQWRVNGTNAGTNSNMFATSTLANGDIVDCIMTSSEMCVSKASDTSNAITMTVKVKVTPDVQIIVLPNDTVCAGTNVTFIATPANEGTTPVYQWQVNGVNVGTNNTSYSSAALADGDIVRVILTSSEMCVTKMMDTSNEIEMKVNPNLTPDVTIVVAPDDTICDGTTVTFTATPVNGGTTPVYQWRVNGAIVGSNSTTYSTSTLANGDVVDCILTSSEICVTKASDTSNAITMTVKPYITPVVTTVVAPNDTVCAGTNVTFTATPVNGGVTPTYQWQVNGANVGTNSATYNNTTPVQGDVVRVIMTSSEMCLTKAKDTSDDITMTVFPNLTPDISITVSPNDTICAGTLVTFLATTTNGGSAPQYQWKINGNNVGVSSSGYASNSFANGDVVTCVLTSSEMCVTRSMDTSNAVAMTVNPLVTPGITINANTGTTACVGGEVTFAATAVNGGSAQAYQWRLNGADVLGANSTTFMSSSLSSGDVVACKLTITTACPAPDTAISPSLTMNMVNPAVNITVGPNDTICDNQSAVFMANAINVGNTPTYQWKLNGANQIGVIGDIFTMNTVGHQDVISIEFTGSDNCINAAAVAGGNTITMTVNPTTAPSVGIAANPGTVLNNSQIVWFTSSANTPNVTYQWRKNGVDIPGATGIVYTDLDPQDGDAYSLFIRTTDSCRTPDTAISNVVTVSVGVGVQKVANVFEQMSLSPNPNSGTFVINGTLAATTRADKAMIEVVNAVGAVIYREEIALNNNELKTRIELGDKAHKGLHMVRIHVDGQVQVLKFIAN